MKKILFLLMGMCVFLSCSKETPIIEEVTTPKEFIVSLGFSGEITQIYESPLMRAAENNDLYGIQVYSMQVENGTQYQPYAYGLFDDKGSITVKLLEGYKYKFVSTMVVDGKSRILSSYEGYYYPFFHGEATPLSNSFTYTSTAYMYGLSNGSSYLSDNIYHRPNTDRYYGENEGYIPVEGGRVSINMKRAAFGVKVVVEGLTEGKITIGLSEAPEMYIDFPGTEFQQIFTFSSVRGCWANDDYSEIIALSASWSKANGETVPIDSRDITFKRNKLTTIQIKISETTKDTGLDITTESAELGDGGTVNIDAGSNTTTPIDTNP
jgi:hypothetical protein